MRLIDADKLMDSLKGNVLIDVTPELEDTIAQQPTAFDKEKVIEELTIRKKIADERAANYDESGDIQNMETQDSISLSFKSAVEIVEKGGIE